MWTCYLFSIKPKCRSSLWKNKHTPHTHLVVHRISSSNCFLTLSVSHIVVEEMLLQFIDFCEHLFMHSSSEELTFGIILLSNILVYRGVNAVAAKQTPCTVPSQICHWALLDSGVCLQSANMSVDVVLILHCTSISWLCRNLCQVTFCGF